MKRSLNMDILTSELINEVINGDIEEENRVKVTNEAIGYLQQLLSPYIIAMQYADTPTILEVWVGEIFTDEALVRILTSIENYRREMKTTVNDIKQAIVYGLLEIIIYEADARATADELLTPWDIKVTLEYKSNGDFAKYFNIATNETTETVLPVYHYRRKFFCT